MTATMTDNNKVQQGQAATPERVIGHVTLPQAGPEREEMLSKLDTKYLSAWVHWSEGVIIESLHIDGAWRTDKEVWNAFRTVANRYPWKVCAMMGYRYALDVTVNTADLMTEANIEKEKYIDAFQTMVAYLGVNALAIWAYLNMQIWHSNPSEFAFHKVRWDATHQAEIEKIVGEVADEPAVRAVVKLANKLGLLYDGAVVMPEGALTAFGAAEAKKQAVLSFMFTD